MDPVEKALQAAIEQNDSALLRCALADHFAKNKRMAEALAEFEAAITLDPSNVTALEGAVRTANALGDSAKAHAYKAALAASQTPVSAQAEADVVRPAIRLVADAGEIVDEALAEDLDNRITFADVGGMEDLKDRLNRSFITPMKNPEMYAKFGKKISGGLVLYGAPGCGKTFIARALAGEIGAKFINIALSDVLDMWFGESEKRIHELFENARRQAPVVVFFDEIDALGQRRTQLKGSAGRNLVNQLLAELDGFAGKNEGVFILGATNHPWDLDPALRRPGRFDRMIFVPPPSHDGRAAIFKLKLSQRLSDPNADLASVVKKTDGYSGADIQAVVDVATDLAIEASMRAGKETPIDAALLLRAVSDTRPSVRAWMETARNYAVYANEGGSYDELLDYLRKAGLA